MFYFVGWGRTVIKGDLLCSSHFVGIYIEHVLYIYLYLYPKIAANILWGFKKFDVKLGRGNTNFEITIFT